MVITWILFWLATLGTVLISVGTVIDSVDERMGIHGSRDWRVLALPVLWYGAVLVAHAVL